MKQHPYYKNIFVTTTGKVYSNKTGVLKQLKPMDTDSGYVDVSVWVSKGKALRKKVHRLVAETYLPNPDNLREVDHIDCDKKNNNLSNLEWVSSKENKRRARLNGLYDNTIGENHHNSVLTDQQVHDICQSLQDGMRNKDVSELYGVHKDVVSHIKIGNLWKHITCEYNFKVKRMNRKSIEFIESVCQKISDGFTNKQINEMFNGEISINDVQRIRAKSIHKRISDSYF